MLEMTVSVPTAISQMVKEFDAVIWKAPLNEVQGCTKTQFGYHLILVTARDD